MLQYLENLIHIFGNIPISKEQMSLRIFNLILLKMIYAVICNLVNAFLSRTLNYLNSVRLSFLKYMMETIIATT